MEYKTLARRTAERNDAVATRRRAKALALGRADVAARMKANAKRKSRILREVRASITARIKAKAIGLAPVAVNEPTGPQRMSPDELARSIGVTSPQLRDGFRKAGIHPRPQHEDGETTIEVTEDEVQALGEVLEREIKMNEIKSRQ